MNTHASVHTIGNKAPLHQAKAQDKLDTHLEQKTPELKPFTKVDLANELLWLEVKRCWHPTRRKDVGGRDRATHGFAFTDPHRGYIDDGDSAVFLEFWIQKIGKRLPDRTDFPRIVQAFDTRLAEHGFRIKAKIERKPVVTEQPTPVTMIGTATIAGEYKPEDREPDPALGIDEAIIKVDMAAIENGVVERIKTMAELRAKAEAQVQAELFEKYLAEARKRLGVIA